MQEFHSPKQASAFRKYRSFIVALTVVLIGGVGFAATGGIEKVRRFFVTVQLVGVDGGQPIELLLETVVEDGQSVPLDLGDVSGADGILVLEQIGPDGENGGTALQFTFEGDEFGDASITGKATVDGGEIGGFGLARQRNGNVAGGNVKSITIQVSEDEFRGVSATSDIGSPGDVQQIRLRRAETVEFGGNTPFDLGQVMLQSLNSKGLNERLAEAEVLETWTTQDRRTRELLVLPVDSENLSQAGLQIVVVTHREAGERMVQLLGVAGGVDPSKTKLVDVTWDNNQVVTIRISQSDGAAITFELKTSDELLDNREGVVRLIPTQDGELKRSDPKDRD